MVVAQVGFMQLPLSGSRPTLWKVECARENFVCSSVSCPLWNHVSRVGRLLVYSILGLTHIGIKAAIPNCLESSSVRVTGNLDYNFKTEHFTFGGPGQYNFLARLAR